jgi:hypothetical protein
MNETDELPDLAVLRRQRARVHIGGGSIERHHGRQHAGYLRKRIRCSNSSPSTPGAQLRPAVPQREGGFPTPIADVELGRRRERAAALPGYSPPAGPKERF